jgi:hypothetical protein
MYMLLIITFPARSEFAPTVTMKDTVPWNMTDVSEERTASCSYTLKMEIVCSCETSVNENAPLFSSLQYKLTCLSSQERMLRRLCLVAF